MRRSRPRQNLLSVLLLLSGGIAVAASSSAARAEVVGTAGAVNTRSTAALPRQAVRVINIGEQVVRNEKISTSGSGSVQVAFLDRTTLNIGRNSSVVIDEFVYSSANASGKVALSLVKGVLRVVGGQATHTGGALVSTPVATIGIRGGIATIEYCPTEPPPAGNRSKTAICRAPGLRVTNHFGQITVTAADGASLTIYRPGFAVTIVDGHMSDAPYRVAQTDVDDANAEVTSADGEHGGSKVIPTDDLADRSGLGHANVPATHNLDAALIPEGVTAETESAIQTSVQQSAAQPINNGGGGGEGGGGGGEGGVAGGDGGGGDNDALRDRNGIFTSRGR